VETLTDGQKVAAPDRRLDSGDHELNRRVDVPGSDNRIQIKPLKANILSEALRKA
jgi:hypothetical protein